MKQGEPVVAPCAHKDITRLLDLSLFFLCVSSLTRSPLLTGIYYDISCPQTQPSAIMFIVSPLVFVYAVKCGKECSTKCSLHDDQNGLGWGRS